MEIDKTGIVNQLQRIADDLTLYDACSQQIGSLLKPLRATSGPMSVFVWSLEANNADQEHLSTALHWIWESIRRIHSIGKVPGGGFGGDSHPVTGRSNSDCRLAARAIRQRWPIADEMKATVVRVLADAALDANESTRDRIAAIKALVRMESQNLHDEASETPAIALTFAPKLKHW